MRVYTTGQVPLEVSAPSCDTEAVLHSSVPVGSGHSGVAGQSMVTFAAQVRVTAGALVTVNVAEHVFGTSHELVTVKVTVLTPPHAGGAPVLLFEMEALQPPEVVAVANHAVNFESIAACV